MTRDRLVDFLKERARQEFAETDLSKSVRQRNQEPRTPQRPLLSTMLQSSGSIKRSHEESEDGIVRGIELPDPFAEPATKRQTTSPPSNNLPVPRPSPATQLSSNLVRPRSIGGSSSGQGSERSPSSQPTNCSPLRFESDRPHPDPSHLNADQNAAPALPIISVDLSSITPSRVQPVYEMPMTITSQIRALLPTPWYQPGGSDDPYSTLPTDPDPTEVKKRMNLPSEDEIETLMPGDVTSRIDQVQNFVRVRELMLGPRCRISPSFMASYVALLQRTHYMLSMPRSRTALVPRTKILLLGAGTHDRMMREGLTLATITTEERAGLDEATCMTAGLILVPMQSGDDRWHLAVVQPNALTIFIYDPLYRSDTENSWNKVQTTRRFIQQQLLGPYLPVQAQVDYC